MKPTVPVETDIVLLGAGHAHVEVLRAFAMKPEPGVRLTLIGREPATPYSGMLPGLIRGDWSYEDAHIDLAPIATAAGARLILGEATAIDPVARTVTVRGRPPVPYDLLSIGVGGTPASVIRAGTLGLPLVIAIIGGEPHRFRPLADLYREAGRRAGHGCRACLPAGAGAALRSPLGRPVGMMAGMATAAAGRRAGNQCQACQERRRAAARLV